MPSISTQQISRTTTFQTWKNGHLAFISCRRIRQMFDAAKAILLNRPSPANPMKIEFDG